MILHLQVLVKNTPHGITDVGVQNHYHRNTVGSNHANMFELPVHRQPGYVKVNTTVSKAHSCNSTPLLDVICKIFLNYRGQITSQYHPLLLYCQTEHITHWMEKGQKGPNSNDIKFLSREVFHCKNETELSLLILIIHILYF